MGKVINDHDVLKAELDGLKSSGKKIVFTNGVFDLLHTGHLRYLQRARELGDAYGRRDPSDVSDSELSGTI